MGFSISKIIMIMTRHPTQATTPGRHKVAAPRCPPMVNRMAVTTDGPKPDRVWQRHRKGPKCLAGSARDLFMLLIVSAERVMMELCEKEGRQNLRVIALIVPCIAYIPSVFHVAPLALCDGVLSWDRVNYAIGRVHMDGGPCSHDKAWI
jgi:hypothetical protein